MKCCWVTKELVDVSCRLLLSVLMKLLVVSSHTLQCKTSTENISLCSSLHLLRLPVCMLVCETKFLVMFLDFEP